MEERKLELNAVMKRRLRALVSALRITKKAQARRMLRSRLDEAGEGVWGYCCLGVACEVAIDGGLNLDAVIVGGETVYMDVSNGSSTVLPLAVAAWYGFDSLDPYLKDPEKQETCGTKATVLNDVVKLTLAQIGDRFEYTFLREDWDAAHATDES